MDYKNYMSGISNFRWMDTFYPKGSTRYGHLFAPKTSGPFVSRYKAPNPYKNESYQQQPTANNVQQNAINELTTTLQQYPQSQQQQTASDGKFDYYKQTLDNPLVSGVYSKGLVQNNGNKLAASEFAMQELIKTKNFLDNFNETSSYRYSGGPGFSGNLQQDRNTLAGLIGQMARYINDLYKSASQQYGNQ